MPVFKALVVTERKQKTPLTIADYDEPTPGPGEVLVENVAVAQNPVDAKQLDYDFGISSIPWVLGADIAGKVYKVGPNVTEFAIGDRVISFLSRKTIRHTAFQTFSIAEVARTVKLPDSYTFEGGSTIPLAYVTAAAGIIHALGVELPSPSNPSPSSRNGEPLLVWGGSGSVGAFVVQLANSVGFTVISTASPANHEYVRSLGAKYVFDYKDTDVVSKIKEAAGSNLSLVYDSISENGSVEASVASITSSKGGKVAVILPVSDDVSTPTVKVINTGARFAQEQPVIGEATYGYLAALLNKGRLIPNKVKIIPGGLLGVNEGFELQRAHKISGEKLVYRIADTKF